MPIHKTNLQELIEKAGYLFRTRGYHNTSIANIAGYCNLSKASVYHYMPSKEALGIAVLNNDSLYFRENFFNLLYDQQLSEKQRLTNFCQAIEKFFSNREGGSLPGNLALEVTGIIPEFEKLIKGFFVEWTEALQLLFIKKYGKQKAQEIAESAIAHIQGAIMMVRIFGEPDRLKRVNQELCQLLDDESHQVTRNAKQFAVEEA